MSASQSSELTAKTEPDATTRPASNGDHHDGHTTSGSFQEKKPDEVATGNDHDLYFSGWRLFVIMATISLSTLIAALDLGIVATAIPAITSDFNSLDNIGWYSSVCFLLVGATAAVWGKLFTYLPVSIVYMSSLVLYLIGSVVAAAAPNSVALIVGRAIQGWGCSGTLGGSTVIINLVAEPKKRPMLLGLWIGVLMLSTIIGPLLGGVFTTELTWRWCFWINLPIGGAAIVLQFFFLRVKQKPAPATWKEILLHLDLGGFTILLASLICLSLALEWGGLTKPWSDGSVIATLVMFAVLTIAFWVGEWLQGNYAMIPFRLLKPRMTWANLLFTTFLALANFQIMFYLPLYFQSVKGTTAIMSGVYNLPTVAFFSLGSMVTGGLMGKTRLIVPFQLASGLLATLGAALIYSLDVDSPKAWFIGAQVPFGFGIGLGNQVPMTALQSFTNPADLSVMMGIVFMCQPLAGAYFVAAAQSVFSNRILESLAKIAPNIDPSKVLSTGAADLAKSLSPEELAPVIQSYMVGIKAVFAFSLAGAALATVSSLLVPFVKMQSFEDQKKNEHTKGDELHAKAIDEKEAVPV